MKKTLVLASLLAAFGAASAQSSVTLGGQLDIAVQDTNAVGSNLKMTETHGSRFFIKGSESLGNGLSAVFNLEHRLKLASGTNAGFCPTGGTLAAPCNGTYELATPGDVFWNGTSTVGLSGAFGTVNFGRQYAAGFLEANNQADPFGGDGQGNLRAVGMRTQNYQGTLRAANSIKYSGNFGPVAVAVSTDLDGNSANKAHVGFAAQYTAGALSIGAGQASSTWAGASEKVANAYATYNLGVAKLHAGFGKYSLGTASSTGMLLAVSAPVGAGTVKAGIATAKSAGVTTNSKVGVGYSQNLSARTSFDVTYGNDSKTKSNGYDLTLTHKF